LGLHLITAWTETIRLTFFPFNFVIEFALLLGCNLTALLLLWRTGALERTQPLSSPFPAPKI
jgi:hypothetical protein